MWSYFSQIRLHSCIHAARRLVVCLTSRFKWSHLVSQGLQNMLAYEWHLRPLRGEGSLSCHTRCDTGPRFLRFHPLVWSRLVKQGGGGGWGPILTLIPTGLYSQTEVEGGLAMSKRPKYLPMFSWRKDQAKVDAAIIFLKCCKSCESADLVEPSCGFSMLQICRPLRFKHYTFILKRLDHIERMLIRKSRISTIFCILSWSFW